MTADTETNATYCLARDARRRRRRGSIAAAASFAVLALLPDASAAQDARTDDAGGAWHAAWSPFAAIADLPRNTLLAPRAPSFLILPDPRVSLGWTMGDPSGFAQGVRERWATATLGGGGTSGTYRRPLDPERASLARLTMLGWQPLGETGGATGRVVIEQEGQRPSSAGDALMPYATSPFVVTDSTAPAMRGLRARLEGAAGWRAGPWSAGASVGYEANDVRSESTPFPRLGRQGAPALGVGAGRALGGVRVSAFGRWQQSDETVTLVPLIVNGTVYQLDGYGEPTRRAIATSPYRRRSERDATAAGLGIEGRVFGADWLVGAERGRRRERYSSDVRDDPPADRWDAEGGRVVVAVKRYAWSRRLLATARAERSWLTGTGRRLDLPGDVFRADESVAAGLLDVRTARIDAPWRGGVVLALRREARERVDFVAARQATVEAWVPGVAAEVARRLGESTDVALAGGFTHSARMATIPGSSTAGEVHRRLIAPALAWEASPATAFSGELTLRQRVGAGRWAWIAPRFDRTTPSGTVAPPLRPEGSRGSWGIQVGATLSAAR